MDNETVINRTSNDFLINLNLFYEQVESWATASGLVVSRSPVSLHEEAYDAYTAYSLKVFTNQNKLLATFIPIGANIIGANARVDLSGNFDLLTIVHLNSGGPRIRSTLRADGIDAKNGTRPLYKGVTDAGWYWIESKKLARAYKIDKTLFFELLSLVSGHEFT